jgi:hypothetical protein
LDSLGGGKIDPGAVSCAGQEINEAQIDARGQLTEKIDREILAAEDENGTEANQRVEQKSMEN